MGTRSFYVEAFTIPSAGMSPTLVIGDHIFVKKYDTDLVRGDVAVMSSSSVTTAPIAPTLDFGEPFQCL